MTENFTENHTIRQIIHDFLVALSILSCTIFEMPLNNTRDLAVSIN